MELGFEFPISASGPKEICDRCELEWLTCGINPEVCEQEEHMYKVIDAEKVQEVNRLLMESFKAYVESERQKNISNETMDKALNLWLEIEPDIEVILIEIKKEFKNGGN